MKITITILCLLLSNIYIAQITMPHDSVFRVIKETIADKTLTEFGDEYFDRFYKVFDVVFQESGEFVFVPINSIKVNQPTDYDSLKKMAGKKLMEKALKYNVFTKPTINDSLKYFIKKDNILKCFIFTDLGLTNNENIRKNFDSVYAVRIRANPTEYLKMQKLIEKELENINDIDNYMLIDLIEMCDYWKELIIKDTDLNKPWKYVKYIESSFGIGAYYSKLIDFYKDKNISSLTIKFPNYINHKTDLDYLIAQKDLDIVYDSKKLMKQFDGTWHFTMMLATPELEDKNKYNGTLTFVFKALAAKPVIDKIVFSKALPKATIIPQKEFLKQQAERKNFPIPPPPPPPPPTTYTKEEKEQIRKRKLEW